MAPPLEGSSVTTHPPAEGFGFMKRVVCLLLVATLPFGSAVTTANSVRLA